MRRNSFFRDAKAQVTAFIIIGIILLLFLFVGIYIKNLSTKEVMQPVLSESELTLQSQTIKTNIDTCIQTLTDKGIKLISNQGFYLNIPNGGYKYNENSAYWIKQTVNIMPNSIKKIEDDITYYVQTNLPDCVAFDSFMKNGWDIGQFDPKVSARILKDDVVVDVNYSLKIKKDKFERKFSDSIYNPNIRIRQMYLRAADLVNNQLLKFCLDSNKPLEGYDSGGYEIKCPKADENVLLCSIADPQSKIIDSSKFTLKFVADLNTNIAQRIYRRSSKFLFSPDRDALLVFGGGSPATIGITQYKTGSVTRTNTPGGKEDSNFINYYDHVFKTSNPIYRFYPNGLSFGSPAILTICSSGGNTGLLHNGEDGWIPYPSTKSSGTINTVMYGIKT